MSREGKHWWPKRTKQPVATVRLIGAQGQWYVLTTMDLKKYITKLGHGKLYWV